MRHCNPHKTCSEQRAKFGEHVLCCEFTGHKCKPDLQPEPTQMEKDLEKYGTICACGGIIETHQGETPKEDIWYCMSCQKVFKTNPFIPAEPKETPVAPAVNTMGYDLALEEGYKLAKEYDTLAFPFLDKLNLEEYKELKKFIVSKKPELERVLEPEKCEHDHKNVSTCYDCPFQDHDQAEHKGGKNPPLEPERIYCSCGRPDSEPCGTKPSEKKEPQSWEESLGNFMISQYKEGLSLPALTNFITDLLRVEKKEAFEAGLDYMRNATLEFNKNNLT